ncbi:polyphosphate kinase [Clostridium sp. CAG:557]|jgi:polyphosphate kinase|nr:polyphosphate kinase [Clostridium sp. CAG:557]
MENQKHIPYNNRELSWLDFNYRVLDEAFRKDNPILERVKFLAISASNLDEFFMVRVAGIMEQINSNYKKKDPSGLSPKQQLAQINEKTRDFLNKQYQCLKKSIKPTLNQKNIAFLEIKDLNSEQKRYVDTYFNKIIFPVLTPLAVDKSRPFPLLANKSLNLAVRLSKDGETNFALVQVPSILPRFLELPSADDKKYFILIENIIIEKLPQLFELHRIKACCQFRITRNSDLDIDEEAADLLVEIQRSIKKRKRGEPVRLELLKSCDQKTRDFLVKMLSIKEEDIYELSGPLDLTFLMKFSQIKGFDKFRFDPIVPVDPPADFWGEKSVFEAIKQRDRLVHHPYESFNAVVNFINQAAADKNVLAIKQTLYRVSGKSPIIDALIKAAENGKQVTVLVELKARFDEENNVIWAKKLEQAGCHVIYGVYGLKTHCKILLVVRQEDEGIKRYIHMATGNYNDSTAKVYTDIGFFTCRESFGADASSLFNTLTGYSRPPEYSKLIVAPIKMRSFFEKMIENEIQNAEKGLPSGITIKINSLVDEEMIRLLYRASNAGVKVDLIVRGICCLIPGIAGFSENITVRSIVGQFLEHSRIYKFCCSENPQIFIGSADLMPRNLDKRVELIFPIEDDGLKLRIDNILNIMLSDTTNAKVQNSDAKYSKIDMRGKERISSQKYFVKEAKQRVLDLEKNLE